MNRFSQLSMAVLVVALAVLATVAPGWGACLTYNSSCNTSAGTLMDVRNDGTSDAAFFYSAGGYGVAAHSVNEPGVYAWSDNTDGVDGQASAFDYSGVYGHSDGGGWGVFGRTTSTSFDRAGVGGENYGVGPGVWAHSVGGDGVRGISDGGGYGVFGSSKSNDAVHGESASGRGVYGSSTNNDGIYATTKSSSSTAVRANNSGGGWAGVFNTNSGTAAAAVAANNNGSGAAVSAWNWTNGIGVLGRCVGSSGAGVHGDSVSGPGVYGTSTTGNAGYFQITNAANNYAAFRMETAGKGYGAVVHSSNAASILPALSSKTVGKGKAGEFIISNTASNAAGISATTNGTGWAGYFTATGLASRGVYIKTAGGQGLLVQGGTKSAVVDTSKGQRALYSEESSEVYFTDYGFGKLKDGKAVIAIDPLFAETVNLSQDYFVFVQPYARAELFVSQTTPTAFEVTLNTGDPNAKFAYRLVAKRKGFETARLEATPCPSESDPGMQPEKPAEQVAALSLP